MHRESITFKLLIIIIGAFIFTSVSVLLIANKQLIRIINDSQNAIYSEKIDSIEALLARSNERLQKTGMVEAYIDDFQQASLKVLRQTYYRRHNQTIYPFVIDNKGDVLMHPKLTSGDKGLAQTEIIHKMLAAKAGDFEYTYQGLKKWCIFKRSAQWDWVIAYTVPLDIKYADAHKFRNLLGLIMGGIIMLVLLTLAMIITRFTKPIIKLTKISTAMADGNLDQEIDLGGNDEVGTLARSFDHMRNAIRRTISELKRENFERSKAERKLIEQNDYINSILESLTHPLYAIDVNDYSIKIANSASGYKTGKATTCYALSHHENSPCHTKNHPCPLKIIKETLKPTMVEHVHFDDKGNKRNIEVYAYPVFDQQGKLIQMIEYGIDVTDRKKAQIELAAEKEQLAVTLRSIGDGVITTDIAGNIILLNKVAEQLTGWINSEAKGQYLADVFHIIDEQTRKICENPITKVINSGQIVDIPNHTVLIAKDGTERNIADSGAPILDAESNTIGMVLVFRDVTEQLKTEKELLKVTKLESIGVLAGGIAHDFNNILAAILGNINMALFDGHLTNETKGLLAEAEKASLRAKDLTLQLLTFAKGGDPVKEVSPLQNVIKDSADFVLHGDTVACRYNLPDDLWLVDIDKGQVGQVIQNIVLNASHAMPAGGAINITAENILSAGTTLNYAKDEKLVKISIQDSGTGIPNNVLEKIFDPYFTTKHEGNGLGLAISQSIISKHDGHITADSTPGIGSTFTIYLPAAQNPNNPEALLSHQVTIATTQARILIMDDDKMVRQVAKAMLGKLGHDISLAVDGEDAINMYRQAMEKGELFDLVIMDLTIPGAMGGKDAVQEILKLDPKARVIVSSGYSNDPVMARFADYGFCAAMVKPYQLQELSRVIGELL